MLETLLKVYYQAHIKFQSLELVLSHDHVADWELMIEHRATNTVIFHMNSFYLTDLAVQGYTALKEWLNDKDDANEYLSSAEIF